MSLWESALAPEEEKNYFQQKNDAVSNDLSAVESQMGVSKDTASAAAANSGIAPEIGAAGIAAAAGLAGGLMSQAAASKENMQNRLLKAKMMGLQSQSQAQGQMVQGMNENMNNSMDMYRSFLAKKRGY